MSGPEVPLGRRSVAGVHRGEGAPQTKMGVLRIGLSVMDDPAFAIGQHHRRPFDQIISRSQFCGGVTLSTRHADFESLPLRAKALKKSLCPGLAPTGEWDGALPF